MFLFFIILSSQEFFLVVAFVSDDNSEKNFVDKIFGDDGKIDDDAKYIQLI